VDLNIKAVQLTAETIPEWQVAQIRATLRCDVILQYGHSEACVFGFSTLNGSDYYCSPFYGVTEVIDSEGQHVDVGQSGEVVVTGLHNRGMPLIRYRTGDEAVYGGTRNGFVILQRVLGRTQDFLLDASGNRVSVTGSIMAQHFSAFRSIAKWQIIQTIPGRVKMKLVKASGYRDEDEMEIRRKLAAACDIKLDIEYVSDIPVTSRGKHRFVINTCIAGPTSRSNPSDC
jgi:phenylacetate-CoA ligase